MLSISSFLAVLVIAAYIVWRLLRPAPRPGSGSARSLPGPQGRLLLGNLQDIPHKDSHLVYAEMAKIHGPIFQLRVPIAQQTLVVISDARIAAELLDRRGGIYSDRPPFYMNDLAGWEWNAAHMRHGDAWRVRRRIVHQRFTAPATARMEGLLRQNARALVKGFLETPEEFRHHIRRFAAANIMKTVYGIDVAPMDDPYVAIAERAVDLLGLIVPGSNLVDVFPLLRFVPPWVPVLGKWTRSAREMRQYPQAMVEVPYARVQDDLKKGVAQECMVTDVLSAGIDEQVAKEASAVSYLGGADTMVSTMLSVVLSMVLYPDVQARAQAELDAVLGERLPTLADMDSLPYVAAVIKETYRHYPVTPIVPPHAVEEDDVYDGMRIPRGATIVPNIWAMLHDPATYAHPERFDPARWLATAPPPPPDPRTVFFGFGRRICPGRHFADASVFLAVASMLRCFAFSEVGHGGKGKQITGEFHTSLISCPVPFECTIAPRSARAVVEMLQKDSEQDGSDEGLDDA